MQVFVLIVAVFAGFSPATPVGIRNSLAPSHYSSDESRSLLSRNLVNTQDQPPLSPAIHWTHVLGDLEHLVPKTQHSLHFAAKGRADPYRRHLLAHVDANFTSSAVLLDHSSHVGSVICTKNSLIIKFTGEKAYNFAKTHWTADHPLVLATNSGSCGSLTNQRSFWEVINLKFESTWTISARVKEELSVQDVLHSADMVWGTWEPESDPLVRRWSFNSFTSGVSNFVSSVANSVPNAIKSVGSSIVNTAGQIGNAINNVLRYDKDISSDIPINVKPSPDKVKGDAPWANSVSLYSKEKTSSGGSATGQLDVYCVNCFMSGSVTLAGRASFSLSGVDTLRVDYKGNLAANVGIGLVAQGTVSKEFTRELFSFAAPPPAGFTIPGILVLGPYLLVEAKAEGKVNIKGQALASIGMSVKDYSGTMDFKNKDNSRSSGFNPEWSANFQAAASITASAGVGLPVALGVGIRVPIANWDKSLLLVDKPMLESEFVAKSDSTCRGVDWNIKFKNDIYVDLAGSIKTISTYVSGDLKKGCLPLRSSKRSLPFSAGSTLEARQDDLTLPFNETDFIFSDSDGSDFNVTEEAIEEQLAKQSEQANLQSVGAFPNGTTFININDTTNSYCLVADEAGNLYPGFINETAGNTFAQLDGVVFGDDGGRLFMYNSSLISNYGASTFTMSDLSVIPDKSSGVALVPAPVGATNGFVYVALTENGLLLYPIVCNYDALPSKLFLALNETLGTTDLATPAFNFMTLGNVTECFSLPLAVAPGNTEIGA